MCGAAGVGQVKRVSEAITRDTCCLGKEEREIKRGKRLLRSRDGVHPDHRRLSGDRKEGTRANRCVPACNNGSFLACLSLSPSLSHTRAVGHPVITRKQGKR